VEAAAVAVAAAGYRYRYGWYWSAGWAARARVLKGPQADLIDQRTFDRLDKGWQILVRFAAEHPVPVAP
jgi:hypothetical protein